MPPPPPPTSAAPLSPLSQNRDTDYAMTHPVNARTHSAPNAPVYFNPLQSYQMSNDENDVSSIAFI